MTDMVKLREAVHIRSNGLCERCGIPLADSWALHHRKLKSRGGTNDLPNVIALHHHCHNLGSDSVHLAPHAATQLGYLVPSWSDPAEVPLILGDGSEVLLTKDGGYLYLSRKDGNGW